MAVIEANDDLIWDIGNIRQPDLAARFIRGLQNNLCVYSTLEEKLYSNYEIQPVAGDDRRLVITPNINKFYDNFHVPKSAIYPTKFGILPGRVNGDISLILLMRTKNSTTRYQVMPLQLGLKMIKRKLPPNRPFLPVLLKGNLQEFRSCTPCLSLHAINPQELSAMPGSNGTRIERLIARRLEVLC